MLIMRAIAVAAMLLVPLSAFTAEPVRRVSIYVDPFYRSAQAPEGQPQVSVGKQYNDLLASNKREDILAGLHRAIVLRAMSLLARSGGVQDEFTFTGGVAKNGAAVRALVSLVDDNYGKRTVNISPDSIYTGALGAALFARREAEARGAGAGDTRAAS